MATNITHIAYSMLMIFWLSIMMAYGLEKKSIISLKQNRDLVSEILSFVSSGRS